MNKPKNEPLAISRIVADGTDQLRYISKRRYRKLRARARRNGTVFEGRLPLYRGFATWLRPINQED